MTNVYNPIIAMLEAAPICGTLWNREGHCVDCNDAALRFFGLSSKKHFLTHYNELSPECQPGGEASTPLLRSYLHKAFSEGLTQFDWLYNSRFDKQLTPVHLTLTRVTHNGHDWVVAYAIEQSGPPPMHSASSICLSRAQLLLDNMPLGCTLWNSRGEIIDCNLESLKWVGLGDKQEFLTRISEFWPEFQPDGSRSIDRVKQLMEQSLPNERITIPWIQQIQDGSLMPCEVTLVQVIQNNEPMLAAFIRDLREEKRLEAETRDADERAQLMLDATPLGCTLWDEEFKPVDCNQEAVTLFGLTSKQEFLERFFELSPEYQPDGRLTVDAIYQNIQQANREGFKRLEWMHQTLDGEPILAEITLVRVRRSKANVIAAYIRDLREEKRLEAEKRKADEYTHIMLDATPLSCTLWNEAHQPIACNQEAVNLFELESKQSFLDHFFELSPKYQPCGRLSNELAHEKISIAFRDGFVRFEWLHQKLDGELIPVAITLIRVPRDDGNIVVCYAHDLRELKETVEGLKRLEKLAYTDKLTGVANRHHFLEKASEIFESLSPGSSFSVLMLDIDHFKSVNDNYGHTAGDAILQGVAARIQNTLRHYDLFARYGGEEFVILMVRTSLDTAFSLAERVREIIEKTVFEYNGQTIKVTLSIGVAACGYPASSLQELIDLADAALYQAKYNGRNQVQSI